MICCRLVNASGQKVVENPSENCWCAVSREPPTAFFAFEWQAKENGVDPASESTGIRTDRVDAVAVGAVTFNHCKHSAEPRGDGRSAVCQQVFRG